MPTNKPNSISSLRGRFDPHYKLAGKVEGLEKGISDQVSQIHKTISKSFVTQRKTLTRVLGLEKRVNHLEIQEAAEEQAKENLDEAFKEKGRVTEEMLEKFNTLVDDKAIDPEAFYDNVASGIGGTRYIAGLRTANANLGLLSDDEFDNYLHNQNNMIGHNSK